MPRFPFLAAGTYAVLVDGGAGRGDRVRPAARRDARVVAIYPSVRRGAGEPAQGLRRVRRAGARGLRRGRAIAHDAFLDMELWDRERRRLTLLLDPGRIKRGLAGHEKAGYPLRGGRGRSPCGWTPRSATPRDGRWPRAPSGATGSVRRCGAASTRGSGASSRRAPGSRSSCTSTARWTASWSSARSPCRASSAPRSARWIQPRRRGRHEHVLHVDAGLEDLAGNSLRRVFDRELTTAGGRPAGGRPRGAAARGRR